MGRQKDDLRRAAYLKIMHTDTDLVRMRKKENHFPGLQGLCRLEIYHCTDLKIALRL